MNEQLTKIDNIYDIRAVVYDAIVRNTMHTREAVKLKSRLRDELQVDSMTKSVIIYDLEVYYGVTFENGLFDCLITPGHIAEHIFLLLAAQVNDLHLSTFAQTYRELFGSEHVTITPESHLQRDLRLDSLSRMRLCEKLAELPGLAAINQDALCQCSTVSDVISLLKRCHEHIPA